MTTDKIQSSDVLAGSVLEKCGFWFRIDFVERKQVYFCKGERGKKRGGALRRMTVDEFVSQYNAGPAPEDGK